MAGGNGGRDHLDRGRTTGMADHDRDRPAQHDVDAAPDLPAVCVVVDVLFEAVAGGKHLTRL